MRTLVFKTMLLLGLCGSVVFLNCLCDDVPTEDFANWMSVIFRPEQLALDTAFLGGNHAEGEVELVNGLSRTYSFDSLSGNCPEEISWQPRSGTIAGRESLDLAFRFDPVEPQDPATCRLDLFMEGARRFSTLEITFAAGEAACALTPGPEVDFAAVEVGSQGSRTLTLRNTTADPIAANQFRYEFGDPSGDCHLFTMDPADSVGVIGPGGSKGIEVRFSPTALGASECRRSLTSFQGSAGTNPPPLFRSCPGEIVFRGVGTPPPNYWSKCQPGGTTDWHGIYGLSESEVYVAGDGGRVIASGGDCQWLLSGTVFADVNLRDIWGHTDGTNRALWSAGNIPPEPGLYGETGAILKSDGGPWNKVDEDGLHTYAAVWGSGLDDVYLAGAGVATDFPNVKHWDGSSLTEIRISDMGWSNVTGLSGTGSNDVWAVLEQNFNSVYRFQGGQWEDQTQPFMTQTLHDVWAIQGTGFYAVYAVGDAGAIYRYDGNTWSDESIPGEFSNFYGVWVSATGQVFVVGGDQVIYRGKVNQPGSWTLQSMPTDLPPGDLLDVWGSSDDDVYAVGTEGVIVRLESGG